MAQSTTRRQWLKTSATGAAGLALGTIGSSLADAGGLSSGGQKMPIKVVVWDEQQPAQREAYENFLGNQIAAHLKTQEGLAVQSVKLDDPEQGLSPTVLKDCRVLIWWGHVRNSEVTSETAKRIVERIKSGDLALIALHSAHWSAPFVEAMNERARLDLGEQFAIAEGERTEVHEIPPPQRFSVPKKDERPTPFATARKYPRGFTDLTLHLPYCCFPAYRNDGMPSQVSHCASSPTRFVSWPESKEQAGNIFPEFSQSRTKLWQRLLTLPPRRPKDRSPTRTPAGNPRSGRRRSGKTGWGHPLFGRNVSLYRIHFHRYWTGVRFRFVEVSEVSAALNAPVGLPIFCRK